MAFTNHCTARYLLPPPIIGWPTFSGLHQSLDSPPSEPYPQIVPLAVIAGLIAIREEEKWEKVCSTLPRDLALGTAKDGQAGLDSIIYFAIPL